MEPTLVHEPRMNLRRPPTHALGHAFALWLALAVAAPAAHAHGPDDFEAPAARVPARTLVIQRIEFAGLSRTPVERAERAAALTLPATASVEVIESATARLRSSGLFRAIDVRTKPGDEPGQIVLVFDVQESRPHLRFGLGYEDFSSWYVMPAQLNADNLTGHGEALRLSARVGYRVAGLDLTLRRPAGESALDFWELRLRGESVDRIYYLDSTETRHHLDRGGVDLRIGRAIGRSLAMEAWIGADNTKPDSSAYVYSDRASLGRNKGDEVPFASLPPQIQRDLGERGQGRLGAALVLDRRAGAGMEMHGAWARASGEGAYSELGDFASWQADARAYAAVAPGVQLAARLRAGAVSAGAPFYERFSVGGLYTVRGYPSQSLSPPQGTLNLGAASVELRHVWWGPSSNPRFTGIAFLDGATGWNRAAPSTRDISWGAGFGVRARVPWLGQVGIDVARPLSRSPVDEAFHVNGSLGWAF